MGPAWLSKEVSLGDECVISRDDLSNKLIHFAKGNHKQAADIFYSILSSEALKGGIGGIRGGYKCVCFTESPIAKLSYIFLNKSFPYYPLGIMVDKKWLYEKGGRPVIYQSDDEFDLLGEDAKYKHKVYNPFFKNQDFSWEREWRIKTEELKLDPKKTTIIVPNRLWVDAFKKDHCIKQQGMVIALGECAPIEELPWHFIALEDLGISIDLDGVD